MQRLVNDHLPHTDKSTTILHAVVSIAFGTAIGTTCLITMLQAQDAYKWHNSLVHT